MNDNNDIRFILNKQREYQNKLNETNFKICKRLIVEDNENGIPITNEPKFGQNELNKEKESIINVINSDIVFDEHPLIIYPESHNVVFTGSIIDLNNLKFQFHFADSNGGCYISCENLSLNEANIDKINKLSGYYKNWKQSWLKKLPTYINNKNNPE